MVFYRLDKQFVGHIAEGMKWRNNLYHSRPTAESRTSQTETIYKPEHPFEQTDKAYSTDDHAEASGSETLAYTNANIVQVGIGALIKLCVQPHQAKVSSGGGGGGNESGWGENDKEKNKYKPKKIRR